MDIHTRDRFDSETSFVLMEEIIQIGKKVVKELKGKDLVILVGNSGTGKSVLFNYLSNIPMREYSPSEKGIKYSAEDFVIDIVDSNSNAAIIRHTNEILTLIPQTASLDCHLFCCDFPGFRDNQENVEIKVANAMNIRNIICAARGVKIILLLEYSLLVTGKHIYVQMIGEIARNLFGCEDGLVQHADSILLGITKIPRAVEKEPFDCLKGFIQHSAGPVICHLSDNLFIFDPLDRDDLKFDRAWNRRQLIEKIKSLSSIANPSEVFRTRLSPHDCLAVQNVCQELDDKIQECISNDELMKAAKYFQKLKSLKVLEHEVIYKAMKETHKNVQNVINKIIIEIEKNMSRGNLDVSKELLFDLRKLVEAFEDKDGEEELKRLEISYKDKNRWWFLRLWSS